MTVGDIYDKEYLNMQTVNVLLRMYISLLAITKVQNKFLTPVSNVCDIQVFKSGQTDNSTKSDGHIGNSNGRVVMVVFRGVIMTGVRIYFSILCLLLHVCTGKLFELSIYNPILQLQNNVISVRSIPSLFII